MKKTRGITPCNAFFIDMTHESVTFFLIIISIYIFNFAARSGCSGRTTIINLRQTKIG